MYCGEKNLIDGNLVLLNYGNFIIITLIKLNFIKINVCIQISANSITLSFGDSSIFLMAH